MDDEKYLELVEHVWNSFLLFEEEEETYLTPDEFNEIIQVMHEFLQNVSGED